MNFSFKVTGNGPDEIENRAAATAKEFFGDRPHVVEVNWIAYNRAPGGARYRADCSAEELFTR